MRSYNIILIFILTLFVITSKAEKKWLGDIKGYNKNDANYGYAGMIGREITGLRVSGGKPYRVHIKGGKWLGEITGYNKNEPNNGYAGTIKGNAIDAIAVKGVNEYTVHVKNVGWLRPVSGYNINDANNGYAGVIGYSIDAVMIKGRTYSVSINTESSSSSSSGSNTTKGKFIEQLAKYAVDEARTRKQKGQKWILPSVCIAQAALETGWGKSTRMKKANAYFGIKAGSSWKGKVYDTKTQECYDGKNFVSITDKFRAYDSLKDSVHDYYDLICKNSRYSAAWNKTSARACITGIKNGGYATDPNYISNIMAIINSNNLTKYDSVVKK